MSWMNHAEDTVNFGIRFIIGVAVGLFVAGIFVSALPTGIYTNTINNVTDAFSHAINVLVSPIFLVAFAVVLVILAGLALSSLRNGMGGNSGAKRGGKRS